MEEINIPRVREVLDEIISELNLVRDKMSKSNPDLVGVFDHSIMKIEGIKDRLSKRSYSYEKFFPLIKMIADLIEIIGKWNNTLFYKLRCLRAA